MTDAPAVISRWQRAVLKVRSPADMHVPGQTGSSFVIDAQRGLLWTCSHVVGQVEGATVRLGMASDVNQPAAWIYEARVVHATPPQEQGGIDGALLRITARIDGAEPQPLNLPGDQLVHADGGPLPALPLGDDMELQLPGDEPAILLGYPSATSVVTPTVGIFARYSHDGEYLLTDSTMLPGHSGGPALNERGEVVGWNVRHALLAVVGGTGLVACGINELRPVGRLIAELAGLSGPAAQTAFGAVVPVDIRRHLVAQQGCISGLLFGRAQAAAYAQQAREHAEQAARSAAQAAEAAGEASAAASEASAAAAQAGKANLQAGYAASSAQRAADMQASTTVAIAEFDAQAAALRAHVVRQAYHSAQSSQPQLAQRALDDSTGRIRCSGLTQPALVGWNASIATTQAGIGSAAVDRTLTMPSAPPVLMMVYVDVSMTEFTDVKKAAFCKRLAAALMMAELNNIRPDQISVKLKPMAGATGPQQKRLWRAAVKAGRCYVKVHVSDEYMSSFSSSSNDSSSASGASLDDEDVLEDEADQQLREAIKVAVATKIFSGPRVAVDDVEPQIIYGPVNANSFWLVVQMAPPLALLLFESAKQRSPALLEERIRCMRLVDSSGVLRDQLDFVAQLDDRGDIQQCLATLEREEPTVLARFARASAPVVVFRTLGEVGPKELNKGSTKSGPLTSSSASSSISSEDTSDPFGGHEAQATEADVRAKVDTEAAEALGQSERKAQAEAKLDAALAAANAQLIELALHEASHAGVDSGKLTQAVFQLSFYRPLSARQPQPAPTATPPADGISLVRDLLSASQRECEDDPESNQELALARRKALRAFEEVEWLQKQIKRVRTRSVLTDEEQALDTSALLASILEIAKLMGYDTTGPTADALQAACAALGTEKIDGTVKGLLAPLRRELDALTSLPFAAPPQLTLLAPSQQQQTVARSEVLRDIQFDDDDEEDADEGQQKASQAPAPRKWTSVPMGAKLHLQMRCEQKGFCYLFHLNQKDELCVVFPNKFDNANAVPAPAHDLFLPSEFASGGRKAYLSFKQVEHLEKETFYLLSMSTPLEECKGVGPLPQKLEKLSHTQTSAVLRALHRAGPNPSAATLRELDDSVFNDDEPSEPSMVLSKMTLYSVQQPLPPP